MKRPVLVIALAFLACLGTVPQGQKARDAVEVISGFRVESDRIVFTVFNSGYTDKSSFTLSSEKKDGVVEVTLVRVKEDPGKMMPEPLEITFTRDELKGKLNGTAVRVPTPNVSLVDLKFLASRATTAEEINNAVKAAAAGPLKGILDVVDAPLVSVDFNHDPASSSFALDQTKVMDGNFVSVMSWYDNEWGFSNRMADVAVALGKLI